MTYLLWHGLAATARRHPDRPAVSWRDTVLTYRQLEDESNTLAAELYARGVRAGERVGILMPKSHRSVVTMLAVLKTGAAYVPVDPAAPGPRVGYILKDCAVKAVVTSSRKMSEVHEFLDDIPELETVVLVDEPAASATAPKRPKTLAWPAAKKLPKDSPIPVAALESDPAYLLYTSGSTGMPKGVVLSHRHALTFVEWGVETFAVTHEDRLSNHAPLHFDLSVFDIYVSLHTGACVHIVPDDVAPFPPKLAQWMDDEGITVSYSVPSALIRLLGHGNIERFQYKALRAVLFAGEVFPMKYLLQLMQKWPRARYYNLYGPTETNVCTFYEVPADISSDAKEIPIGAAIRNCECFAIDDQGKVVQPGGSGELYVRGPLLLLGYWNQPAKTKEMLVPNPIQTAYPEMAYRTGDICRLDADGNYWFTGRRDHMVKSRGYRIELGDIEAALYKHEGINEAVIIAVPDEEVGSRLHAFVVPHSASLGEKELSSFCSSQLPRYMVPETWWFEKELPKTSTGKIDRQTLARRLSPSNS